MSGPKCLRCGADSSWLQGKVPDDVPEDCHGNCPEALGYATGVAAMRGERDNARAAALEEAAGLIEDFLCCYDSQPCGSSRCSDMRKLREFIRARAATPTDWGPLTQGADATEKPMPFEQDTMTHEPDPPAARVTHAALFNAGPLLVGPDRAMRKLWRCRRCVGEWYKAEDVPEFCEPKESP